jgi:hypothetical protein
MAAGLASDAAAAGAPDERTRDQLRADVLVDLVLARGLTGPSEPPAPPAQAGPTEGSDGPAASASAPALPGPTGPPPTPGSTGPAEPPAPTAGVQRSDRPDVQVVIRLETLLGLDDRASEVTSLGPIPADLARALAADGRWRAWLTDAEGAVTATGSIGYVPSAAVARLVRAREPHCRFPGCRQPAVRCDLDHALPWPQGRTTADNLGPLCRRHHNLKTHGSWELRPGEPDGSPGWSWRTPAGLTVADQPGPALPEP